MTERLYYTDPGLLDFEATILSTEMGTDGLYMTRLNRSAFYPTSGGQSHDLGSLAAAEIVDVVERDGEVIHLTGSSPGQTGETIMGQVQYERRMKNRQLHTAQHLLSQIFFRLIDAPTVSVHLGDEYGAIEFDTPSISDSTLAEAERMANQKVIESLPVEILFVDSSEVSRLSLRREPKRAGKLRIIRIGEFEATACGGTHCDQTGQVQLVKLIGVETIRKRSLVKFLAGAQALHDYSERLKVTNQLTRALTSGLADLPDKFEKLVMEIKELKRELTATRKELIPSIVADLLSSKVTLQNYPAVISILPENKSELAQPVALELAEQLNGLALLVIGDRIVVACSKTSTLNAGELMRALMQAGSVKGGGNDILAQGAGASADSLDRYREIILGAI